MNQRPKLSNYYNIAATIIIWDTWNFCLVISWYETYHTFRGLTIWRWNPSKCSIFDNYAVLRIHIYIHFSCSYPPTLTDVGILPNFPTQTQRSSTKTDCTIIATDCSAEFSNEIQY